MNPIQDYVPQHPPLLLLDTLEEASKTRCHARLRVDSTAWYATPDGAMPAWFGLELMAQTAAAHSGWKNRHAPSPSKGGYLLGTRRYTSSVDRFPGNATLEIHAELDYSGVFGQSAFACQILLNGITVAEATLRVLEIS